MSNYWMLYWFTRLDSINGLLLATCVVCGIAALICAPVYAMSGKPYLSDEEKKVHESIPGLVKWLLGAFLISALLAVFVPTQKDMALIIGGNFAIEAAKSPKAEKMGNALYEAVMAQLKKAAQDKSH